MAKESLTWDAQQLAKLNQSLAQHHPAHQTILLTGYYYASALQLGIKAGSPQHQLYVATINLDHALASVLRQHQGPDRLAFYRHTIKPFDAAFTTLMCQLAGKDLLNKAPNQPLTDEVIARQLDRIATFKQTVKALPGIQSNLLLTCLAFIQQLKAWVQGKPYNAPPLPQAIDQFVTANRALLGVRYGR